MKGGIYRLNRYTADNKIIKSITERRRNMNELLPSYDTG